jgi:hypothetical protein
MSVWSVGTWQKFLLNYVDFCLLSFNFRIQIWQLILAMYTAVVFSALDFVKIIHIPHFLKHRFIEKYTALSIAKQEISFKYIWKMY